ncbi:MAG: threonylcarbamoyl-AMP synthase [Calditrichae bacterium]|nr:threonylcarbamoyl-AMP synthase [Calditrichia bacterium]
MQSLKVNQDNPELQVLEMTSQALLNEEVIIHPTETVYGFAAVFQSVTARKKILDIKKRSDNHPMSIMVNNIDQILEISGLTASAWLKEILIRLLPAPLTILLPRNKNLHSDYWDQFPKLGFRYPDHILSQRLLECTGTPLITTSANFSGKPPALAARDLPRDLKQQVSIILDGGPTQEKIASTILELDLKSEAIKQVRHGALSWQEIEKRIAGHK